jgi:hypothetical protein
VTAIVNASVGSLGDANDYDLVGFSITPSRALDRFDKEQLDLDIQSLLSSLAFPPPGVRSVSFDLRYLAISDVSITGKQLVVALLCRLDYLPELKKDAKLIRMAFQREFNELISLHLEEYDYHIQSIQPGEIWKYLEPFQISDFVEISRRVTKLRPLRMSTFKGRSPMSRAVDMLLRQQAQMCFSVYLEPHPLTEDESRELEIYGYETDLLPQDDRDLRDLRSILANDLSGIGQSGTSTPFRCVVRVASDKTISQYVVNLLGSEISGRRDYTFYRPATTTQLEDAKRSFAKLQFFATETEPALRAVPESLRNLQHILQVSEAQAAFRLPTERIATSRERTFKTYQAPVANLPSEGLLLGFAEHPSYQDPLPVRVKSPDRRRHIYVVGKTGTGKSMLLLNMLIQDINEGRGVCLIDPHGDLVEAVSTHIPKARSNDVIYFDPADPDRVCGLNFLEATSDDTEEEKDFLIQEVIAMIIRMVDFNIEMYGPVGQQMTRMACRTLMATDEPATLLEVPLIFASDRFRRAILERVEDTEIKRWWQEEWEPKTTYQRQEYLGWFTSKFSQFVSAPAIRNVIGQNTSTFSLEDVMDNSKILLVNLSRGKIGSLNSAALGSMVVSKLLWAATRRAWRPESTRKDFYLYVDEFQNFISDSFETILSEARKYRLNLVIAHQHLGQLHGLGRLGDRVERAVFGNVGTMVTFRVGTDAGRVADELGAPVEASTLRSLENRYCVAELLVDDIPTMPFTMRTANYEGPSEEERMRSIKLMQNKLDDRTPLGDIARQIAMRQQR